MKYWFEISAAVLIVIFFVLTQIITNQFVFFVGFVILQYVVMATAWNILGGYGGYVNFGSAGFLAVGAYTSVALINFLGVGLIEQMIAGAIIAGLLGLTRQAVAHTMKQLEIPLAKPGRPSAFLSKVQKLNFESIEDYFRARSIATFESMAEELGVSTSTVHRYHREFVKRISNLVSL